MYTRIEYNCLEFSFSIPISMFFLIRWWFGSSRLSELPVSFITFFQKGGSVCISCCHLKFEILLRPNSSWILLQGLTFPLLSNNWWTKFRLSSEKSRKNDAIEWEAWMKFKWFSEVFVYKVRRNYFPFMKVFITKFSKPRTL